MGPKSNGRNPWTTTTATLRSMATRPKDQPSVTKRHNRQYARDYGRMSPIMGSTASGSTGSPHRASGAGTRPRRGRPSARRRHRPPGHPPPPPPAVHPPAPPSPWPQGGPRPPPPPPAQYTRCRPLDRGPRLIAAAVLHPHGPRRRPDGPDGTARDDHDRVQAILAREVLALDPRELLGPVHRAEGQESLQHLIDAIDREGVGHRGDGQASG